MQITLILLLIVQAKVLVINLGQEMDLDVLSYIVLEEPEVREWLFFADVEVKVTKVLFGLY